MEELINVGTFQSRCLIIGQVELVCELLPLLGSDLSVWQVNLIGNQHFVNVLARVGLDLLQPVRDVLEGKLLCAIVNQEDSHGALVVRLGDRSKAFLTCGVPHLQLHSLVVHGDRLDLEVDTCFEIRSWLGLPMVGM